MRDSLVFSLLNISIRLNVVVCCVLLALCRLVCIFEELLYEYIDILNLAYSDLLTSRVISARIMSSR